MPKQTHLNINIQAHPKRKQFVDELLKKLGKKIPVIWDEKNDVWDTRKRCLQQHIQAGAKWSLTIQDDALVTKDFIRKVEKFLAVSRVRNPYTIQKGYAVNFYFGTATDQRVFIAKRKGYLTSRGMRGGVAICLPTNCLQAIIDRWENTDELKRHDDSRIGRFLREREYRTYIPYPSLTQHRNSPSLIYKGSEMPAVRQTNCYEEDQ